MRRLAVSALSFSAAVFAANYILPLSVLPVLCIALLALGVGLMFFRRRWLLLFELIAFFAALGLGVFALKAQFTTVAAERLSGRTCVIECRVLDHPKVYDDYARLDVKLCGDVLPGLGAILYDNELEMTGLLPGQVVRLEAKLKAADTRYGKDYDAYNSRDIYLTASSKGSPELIYEGSHITALPALLRHRLLELTSEIFPDESSGFMQSLLLGDKTALYEDKELYSDLSRAGFMHVAAVSGMHIAFLVALIQLFFGCSAASSVLCILLVWAFALISGSSPSAIRAAFMQSVLLFAPIVRRENDPITSLSAILALVLLFNPYAAASVSLQLSFGALAGILCFNAPVSKVLMSLIPGKRARRLLRYPAGILSVSLSVLPFTLVLSAVHFGEVAVLSPISNMLALWAVSAAFSLGFICCVVGAVCLPLAIFLGKIVTLFASFIFLVASWLASAPFAVVYMSAPYMPLWLGLSLLIFALVGLSRVKGSVKLFYPLLLSAFMLFCARGALSWSYSRGEGSVAVLDVGQGQSIAAISGEHSVVVDCGGGGMLDKPGKITGAYLLSRGRDHIDCLLLTHLHGDHTNGVTELMELVDIGEIVLPANAPDPEGLLPKIEESARRHSTALRYVEEDCEMSFGALRLELFEPNTDLDINEACLMCRLYINDFDVLITADGSSGAENRLIKRRNISDVDVLIAGHHGSRYSSGAKLLKTIGADTAVISVGYNSYGHPTYEALERLAAYGYNIYRTDLNGTVEFRLDHPDDRTAQMNRR